MKFCWLSRWDCSSIVWSLSRRVSVVWAAAVIASLIIVWMSILDIPGAGVGAAVRVGGITLGAAGVPVTKRGNDPESKVMVVSRVRLRGFSGGFCGPVSSSSPAKAIMSLLVHADMVGEAAGRLVRCGFWKPALGSLESSSGCSSIACG